jgi:GxxExxY protein
MDSQVPALDPLTDMIIGAAIEVHRHLGPGLMESAYSRCLQWELSHQGFRVECELPLPVKYKGNPLDCGYRLDLVVGGEIIVELKSVEKLLPIHDAQLLTYLKLSGLRKGLLLNFNVRLLRDGIRRISN